MHNRFTTLLWLDRRIRPTTFKDMVFGKETPIDINGDHTFLNLYEQYKCQRKQSYLHLFVDANGRIAFLMRDFSFIWAARPNADLANTVSHEQALANGWISMPNWGPKSWGIAPQKIADPGAIAGKGSKCLGGTPLLSRRHWQYRHGTTTDTYEDDTKNPFGAIGEKLPTALRRVQNRPQLAAVTNGKAMTCPSSRAQAPQVAQASRLNPAAKSFVPGVTSTAAQFAVAETPRKARAWGEGPLEIRWRQASGGGRELRVSPDRELRWERYSPDSGFLSMNSRKNSRDRKPEPWVPARADWLRIPEEVAFRRPVVDAVDSSWMYK